MYSSDDDKKLGKLLVKVNWGKFVFVLIDVGKPNFN